MATRSHFCPKILHKPKLVEKKPVRTFDHKMIGSISTRSPFDFFIEFAHNSNKRPRFDPSMYWFDLCTFSFDFFIELAHNRLGSNSIFELKVTKIMEGFVYDEKPPLIDIDPKINYLLAVK